MNNEFDLKTMREVWQNQTTPHQYSQNEIFEMLKRKSMTSVKWIFYISLTEIILGILIIIYSFFSGGINAYHTSLFQHYGVGAYFYEFVLVLATVVNVIFIYQFFIGYRKVNAQLSVKALTEKIISFKNIVTRFIYFNLFSVIFIFIVALLMLTIEGKINILSEKGLIILTVTTIIFAITTVVIWLYYYLLYGTFIRRLKKNLKALSEMN